MSKKSVKKPRTLAKLFEVSENLSPVDNSFLHETSFNSNIDSEIREEIERKFKKSSVNASYVFPRNLHTSEPRRKKTPLKARSQTRPRLLTEKSLPVLHKITKSIQDSTNILSHLVSMKKMHRATSSIRNVKESKVKMAQVGRFTPLLTHNRSSSHCAKRSNTPAMKRAENLESTAKRTKFRRGREEAKRIDAGSTRKLALKKPGHFYTVSMESVVPGTIIKSVAYY
jgi:hypothetical protein